MFTTRLGALSIAFRVAGFGRADQTKFPWISPVTCEGDTTLEAGRWAVEAQLLSLASLFLVICPARYQRY